MTKHIDLETEEDTKERRITPALKAAGWSSAMIWMVLLEKRAEQP